MAGASSVGQGRMWLAGVGKSRLSLKLQLLLLLTQLLEAFGWSQWWKEEWDLQVLQCRRRLQHQHRERLILKLQLLLLLTQLLEAFGWSTLSYIFLPPLTTSYPVAPSYPILHRILLPSYLTVSCG